MEYILHLPSRPFNAIQAGSKKVEGRVLEDITQNDRVIEPADMIIFNNENNGEVMSVTVSFIHHYPDVRSMLEAEGVKDVLSSGGDIEDGIKNYHSFSGYPESIKQNGIYAIGLGGVL